MSGINTQCDCPPNDCQSLVARYLAGELAAGDEICRKFERLAHVIAARIMGSERSPDWDDARQIALMRLLSKLQAYRGTAPFCKYAAVVMARSITNSQRVPKSGTANIDVPAADRVNAFQTHSDIQRALQLVSNIDPRWGQLLELKLDGASHDQICTQLGVNIETIQSWWQELKEYLSAFFVSE